VPFAERPFAALGERRENLRDHVARALHLHEVADAQILLVNQLLIVQRRELHRRAADLHRLEDRVRVERTRAPDVHLDAQEPRDRDVRRELSRDGPTRLAPADRAELLLHPE